MQRGFSVSFPPPSDPKVVAPDPGGKRGAFFGTQIDIGARLAPLNSVHNRVHCESELPPMTKAEMLARIDAEIARLKALNPLERAELDRLLEAAHQSRTASDLTSRVLGK